MPFTGIDHFSGHLSDPGMMEPVIAFYRDLGFTVLHQAEWRAGLMDKIAITAGEQKIHIRADATSRVAPHVGWVWEGGIDTFIARVQAAGLSLYRGPTPAITGRDNATAKGIVVIVRHPEGTWIAVVSYDPADLAKYDGPTYDERYRKAVEQGEDALELFRRG